MDGPLVAKQMRMPSFEHEAIVELFRHRETLAAELVERLLGVRLPRFARVSIRESELGESAPTERRADLVVVLEDDAGRPAWAIIVEVQLRRDREKPFAWPLYQAGLRARLRCPCCVLVVTPSPAVARWAERPVDTGQPGAPFWPLVLGPRVIPRLARPEAARENVELALLSALAHGRTAEGAAILASAARATQALEGERSVLYLDVLWRAAGVALRRHLEDVMDLGKYEFANKDLERIYNKLVEAKREARQEGLQEGRQEGLQEGRQEGRQQGRQEGRQQGRQEGRQQGRQEALAETARKLLARGWDAAEVAELTGLSVEDVQRLAH